MSLDLSSLLAGAGDPDLTDALTSVAPNGDLVFQKPFGDSTLWRTKNGYVRVVAVFDPFLPWSNDNILASTTPSYMQEIRRALGEHLVPDKMAPQIATAEEVYMEKVRALLPAETLKEYFKGTTGDGKSRLDEYLAVIKRNVDEQFQEDVAILEALNTREFVFTYHLAVDAYPQDKKSRSAEGGQATSNDRTGVLVFHIEGNPNAPLSPAEARAKKLGMDMHDDHATATPAPEEMNTPPSTPPAMRKKINRQSKKDQKELEQLIKKLEIDPHKVEEGHNVWMKKLPLSSSEFFEQLSAWFGALLQRKAEQFAKKETGASAMYR